MEAGRELDALVAEKVMQTEKYWAVMFAGSHYGNFPTLEAANKQAEKIRNGQTIWNVHVIQYYEEPSYSTDIKAAWEVIGKVIDPSKYEYGIRLEYCTELAAGDSYKAQWLCAIHTVTACPAYEDMNTDYIVVRADTAPLAICMAALKAVGYNKEEA